MAKHLTQKMKMEYFELLIKRDEGFCCWYCKTPLKLEDFVYEHLNNKREDNRIENIILCCHSCNNKKPYDFDMQILAKEKLKQNEDGNFMRERKFQTPNENKLSSTEIDINISNFSIIERYIAETIETDGNIPFSEALDSGVYLCKKKTNHGSHQCVRNYLNTLTSSVAPFEIVRDENSKKIIVKRKGN